MNLMKKVWTTPSLVQCDLVKAILESEGVTCLIRNETNARFAGIGYPMPSGQALLFAWPELWVPDEQLEIATEIVEGFTKAHEQTLAQDQESLASDESESD